MKPSILSSGGMTLVETLVAGIIGLILAGIIIVIYLLFNNQVKENNAYFIMQMQYENLSEQIGFNARRAHKILDASLPYYDTCDIYGDTVSAVKFYNTSGALFAGVGIYNDTVKEIDTVSKKWIPFKTGNGTVVAGAASFLFVNGCRNGIALNLNLKFTDRDTVFYLDPRKDEFLCRN